MNILLIEDSRFLRTVIERALSKTGHRVTGVANGEEGLRLVRTSLPDLILVGYDAARHGRHLCALEAETGSINSTNSRIGAGSPREWKNHMGILFALLFALLTKRKPYPRPRNTKPIIPDSETRWKIPLPLTFPRSPNSEAFRHGLPGRTVVTVSMGATVARN
jgi:hypothetical protein